MHFTNRTHLCRVYEIMHGNFYQTTKMKFIFHNVCFAGRYKGCRRCVVAIVVCVFDETRSRFANGKAYLLLSMLKVVFAIFSPFSPFSPFVSHAAR